MGINRAEYGDKKRTSGEESVQYADEDAEEED
jgi:hypothetical protein